MIITELAGGLGNQMFQYAAGKCLAHQNHVPLLLDTKYLLDRKNPSPDFVFRDFDLGIWNITPRFATDKEVELVTGELRTPENVLQKISRRLKQTFLHKDYTTQVYKESQFHFDKQFYQQKTPLYLQGYWQSEKYFEPIATILRQEFTFCEPLATNCQDLYTQITTTESVCLNIRRGDFVNIQKTNDLLGFTGLDYLHQGVSYVAERIQKPLFFVFSDEITWCKENIALDFPITFVSHEYAGKKFKDYLALMVACKHFVIPNSTFAWWAAWLATNPTKIVVSPKKWFANETINSQDLIPTSWIRL